MNTMMNPHLRLLLTLSSVLFLASLKSSSAVNIQKEIIKDMMTPTSSNCQASPGTFSTSFAFESSQANSAWNPEFVKYEDGLFLAKIQHNDSSNPDQEWTIRIGQAGNIYSFYGPMGETVPPQRGGQSDSPWVDEVWQQVSPVGSGGDHDIDPSTGVFFIHEAGAYTRDPPYAGVVQDGYNGPYAAPEGSTPFYSPTLGKYCDDETGECGFLSWGAQAHLPTDWKSPMIYINRYSDCGDGVIEYTSARHSNDNVACDDDPDNSCPFSYLNVPWGGTRSTVLKDVVMTNSDNGVDHVYPIGSWGSSEEISDIKPLSQTAGYTIFTEDIPHVDDGNDYELPNGVEYVFTSSCNKAGFHSDRDGQLVVNCNIEQTQVSGASETQRSIRLVTDNNECSVAMYRVLHFAWTGKYFYFYPEIISGETETATVARIQNCFTPGTMVTGSYINKPGKPLSENRALSHVHGIGAHNSNGNYPRVRAGYSPSTSRQYNVYTVNDITTINKGDTYIANQYFIMDKYESMQSKGPLWSLETSNILKTQNDYSNSGRTINIFRTVDGSTFGATIGSNLCGEIEPTCVGSTTPTTGAQALFAIQCGTSKVVTDDPYYFSPQGTPVRAYVCDGLEPTVRPQWDLLGFFENNACGNILNGLDYDTQFCESITATPTANPSASPTANPTAAPTENPSANPSVSPTATPTANPSASPTATPTANPPATPTANPTASTTTSSTTSPNDCIDSPLNAAEGGGTMGCDFVSSNMEYCSTVAASHCPKTCDACAAYGCFDSEIDFVYDSSTYACSQFDGLPPQFANTACSIQEIADTCRGSCNTCNL